MPKKYVFGNVTSLIPNCPHFSGRYHDLAKNTKNKIFRHLLGNITFFKAKYDGGEIKLSKEHSEFLFRNVKKIKNPTKFEKVAKKAIKND